MLSRILKELMYDVDSDDRQRAFDASDPKDFDYLFSGKMKSLRKNIKVHKTDHNGRNWSFIIYEFTNAEGVARKATEMFPDKSVQLEMDFFRGVCHGDDWQVGHIGLSDRNHRYWPLSFIIAKSENHWSAGQLLSRALDLVKSSGGICKQVLVDGGKALDKAIGQASEDQVCAVFLPYLIV